jgi:hypothetical protein
MLPLHIHLNANASTVIMIPDKTFPFAKAKSDNLMKFPAFLFLGFLDRLNELHGLDIIAVNMEMSVMQVCD